MARLMVMEDDVTIGGHLESGLRAHGHEVVWQRTCRGAIEEADTSELGLVLLDLGLPDLDAVEVCRRPLTDPAPAVHEAGDLPSVTARGTIRAARDRRR